MNAAPSVFLSKALQTLRAWLADDSVVEICANEPERIWVEVLGASFMVEHKVPSLTEEALRHLSERVAAETNQSVNHENPLLSAALPTGERFQGVLPPAAQVAGLLLFASK